MSFGVNRLLQKAHYLIDLSRPKEAEQLIKDYLSESPNDSPALALLSLCRLQQNDFEQAITFAKQSNAQQPNFQAFVVLTITYFHSKNYKELTKVIDLGKSLYPYGYQFFKYEALLAKEQHKFKKATRLVNKGIAIAPDKVDLHNLKGELLNLRGKKKQAKAAFDLALSIDPNHPQTHSNQGWLALEKGHFTEAQHFFQTALRKDPTSGEGYRGYKLALKSEVRWFRPFIRYIAYTIKALPVLTAGIFGGVVSQAGSIGSKSWGNMGFFLIVLKVFLGIILFFWLPFALSTLVGIRLGEQEKHARIFGGEEKRYAQKHLGFFLLVLLIFILLLLLE